VHPQPDGDLDIDELLGPLAQELASYNLGNLSHASGTTITKNLNWKLANDTFGETYHFHNSFCQALRLEGLERVG